jgi:hypothetical protein
MLQVFVPPLIYLPLIITSKIFANMEAVNVVFMNICISHVMYVLSRIDVYFKASETSAIVNLLYLYEYDIRNFLLMCSTLALSIVYQNVFFMRYICDDNCEILNNIMKSFQVFLGLNTVIYLFIICFYAYSFVSRRQDIWFKIVNKENLLKFNAEVEKVFQVSDWTENVNFISRKFINKWRMLKLSDNEKARAAKMYDMIVSLADANDNGRIEKEEFERFVYKLDVVKSVADNMWNILTDEKLEAITMQSIVECTTEMDRERKAFANMIYTDGIIVKWIKLYISLVLYGLYVVIVFNIFGYQNAFGSGIDLFKLYLFCVTYIFGVLRNQIQFLVSMVISRPYNVGDLILFEDDVCTITNMTSSVTEMDGKHKYFIKNTQVLDLGVRNLSKGDISDSLTIDLPVNHFQSINRITELMEMYTQTSNCIKDVRVAYNSYDRDMKRITIHWAYKTNMFDRGSFSWERTYLVNNILMNLGEELGDHWMKYSAASGGAYNKFYEKDFKI